MDEPDAGRLKQLEILRQMSAAEKLQVMCRLYWSARQLKEAWIRSLHPDWSAEQVRRGVSDAFLYRHD